MAFSGKDETITCMDCKTPFMFTVKDQAFYTAQQWPDAPKRCKPCRQAKKQRVADKGTNAGHHDAPPVRLTSHDPGSANRRGGGGGRGNRRERDGNRRDDYSKTWKDD